MTATWATSVRAEAFRLARVTVTDWRRIAEAGRAHWRQAASRPLTTAASPSVACPRLKERIT